MPKKTVEIIGQYEKVFQNPKRYNLFWGGRGRGGTVGLVQFAFSRLFSGNYSRIALMRYISADIKDSVQKELEDFLSSLEVMEELEVKNREYIHPNGNLIALKSFKASESDNTSKIKGLANFNVILIDELDQLKEMDFNQLDISLRKEETIILATFNPPEKSHWIWKRFFTLKHSEHDGYYTAIPRENINAVFTTYEHNPFLPDTFRTILEEYKRTNYDYYLNQIKGFIPSGKTGMIFKNWKEIPSEEYDDLPYSETLGLDFGYSNDPAALVGIKRHNNTVWTKEYVYKVGLTNQDLIEQFKILGIKKTTLMTADSAEPKSIEEIRRAGYNIRPSVKGKDSINNGIDNLLSSEVFYTSDSHNILEETLNYTWKLDKEKEPTNTPIDKWNHAMDAIRYANGKKKKFFKPFIAE